MRESAGETSNITTLWAILLKTTESGRLNAMLGVDRTADLVVQQLDCRERGVGVPRLQHNETDNPVACRIPIIGLSAIHQP